VTRSLFRPRSILRLITLGFSLVTLPLIVALVNAALSVERLASQSQQAVWQAVNTTKVSRQLVETLIAMERNARQYQVLGEEALFDVYKENHASFRDTISRLGRMPLEESYAEVLSSLRRQEIETYHALNEYSHDAPEMAEAIARFGEMAETARRILTHSNEIIDQKVDSMGEAANRLEMILMWQTIGLVPAALLLAALFTVLITGPIRQINRAIERLGAGDFVLPVKVCGPADLRRLGDRLEWLRARLAELEEGKKKFLRHISHELKTPLTTLREGTELLQEKLVGPLNPRQEEISGILHRSAVHLQRLIEDLLNFSVVTGERPGLRMESLDFGQLIKTVAREHRLNLSARKLQLRESLEPVPVMGDTAKLKTVIDNLLTNAVKYSPDRGLLQLRLFRDGDAAVLEVEDSGPGIPREEREQVFEAFYQGSTPCGGHLKGTGLGLSIAREYVEAHRGTISVVDPISSSGACLRVTLPAETRSERAA
jgi:two-component system sensor histidine kinase GlrK